MTQRIDNPAERFFNASGEILAYGRMDFYEPLTTKKKPTYSDPNMINENASTVSLDEFGVIPDVFVEGAYKGRLRTSGNVQIWNRDYINPYNLAPFDEWSPGVIYSYGENNIVTWEGKSYVSTSDDNLDNDPETSPDDWQEIGFIPASSEDTTRIVEIGQVNPDLQAVIVADAAGWSSLKLADIFTGYIGGLSTAMGTDSDHDIDIVAGTCTDSSNSIMMMTDALTKQIDATWVAGNNAGGMASGVALGNNTWYHLFVVSVGGVIDAMFDTSITCANGAANNGVTHFRRIASVRSDGSANITPYFQNADYFFFDSMPQDYNAVVSSSDAIVVTLTTPPGVSTKAIIRSSSERGTTAGAATYLLISAIGSADSVPSASIYSYAMEQNAANTDKSFTLEIDTDTASAIKFRRAGTVAITVRINTIGYIDKRGQ